MEGISRFYITRVYHSGAFLLYWKCVISYKARKQALRNVFLSACHMLTLPTRSLYSLHVFTGSGVNLDGLAILNE